MRAALEAAEAGAWSVAEADLRHLVSTSRELRTRWLNPSLEAADGTRLPTPDGWLDDVALAVQVHSWRWHSSADDWDKTVTGDSLLTEYGIFVIGVTPRAIRQTPADVVRRIERARHYASARPRPPVVATPFGTALTLRIG